MREQAIPDLNRASQDLESVQVTSHFANRNPAFASLSSLNAIGQTPVSRARRGLINEPMTYLGDQLVQGMVVFPKTGRIVANQHGVFIPQNVLGHNVSVKYESELLPNGGVRVVVCSCQHNRTIQAPVRVDEIDCSRELRWLDEHRQEYVGQWVALQGDRLLAHGLSARDVYDEARGLGVEVPSLLRIESLDEFPFGGW